MQIIQAPLEKFRPDLKRVEQNLMFQVKNQLYHFESFLISKLNPHPVKLPPLPGEFLEAFLKEFPLALNPPFLA